VLTQSVTLLRVYSTFPIYASNKLRQQNKHTYHKQCYFHTYAGLDYVLQYGVYLSGGGTY